MLIDNYKMDDDNATPTRGMIGGSTSEDNGKLLRTVSFKHALQKTINQDLTALLQDLLDVTIDDMEYKDNDFKCQNRKLKRVLSLPNMVNRIEESKHAEISEVMQKLKVRSVYKMRRRLTFPAPQEIRDWKLDHKEKHVL